MSHSIKNLREVHDSAPDHGFGDNQEARFAREALDAETTGLAYHVIKAGKRQGFAHKHDDAEEVYVVLSGTGRIKLDDEILDIGPMDAIRIAPSVARALEAGADAPMEILAFGPHHDKDGELVHDPGFWG
ncbi:MAG TPA: cupin domain-containing protein [Thermoleophilaceae bacterium]|nr:cupin domain-containing protein [Thermoleophilaceae bacterium]